MQIQIRDLGSGIWDPEYFRPRIRDLGSGMEKLESGIRDKHSGSATLRNIIILQNKL
jgi:hypothetical protein